MVHINPIIYQQIIDTIAKSKNIKIQPKHLKYELTICCSKANSDIYKLYECIIAFIHPYSVILAKLLYVFNLIALKSIQLLYQVFWTQHTEHSEISAHMAALVTIC